MVHLLHRLYGVDAPAERSSYGRDRSYADFLNDHEDAVTLGGAYDGGGDPVDLQGLGKEN